MKLKPYDNPDYGDILIWHQDKYSKNQLVRLITALIVAEQENAVQGDYDHAGIIVNPKCLGFVEAFFPFARYRQLDMEDLTSTQIDVFSVDGVTREQKLGACKIAITQIGQIYPIWNLLSFGKIKSKLPICTKLVCNCYEKLNNMFKSDPLICPNELVISELITYKGTLNYDYWKTIYANS